MHSADDLVMCFGGFNGHVVGILIGCVKGIVYISGIWKEECYYWSRNYVCQILALRELKIGR